MTCPEIIDTLDEVAVSLWVYDDDDSHPFYEGATRAYYRGMATKAIEALVSPPWESFTKNLKPFRKLMTPRSECLRQAYLGILSDIAHKDLCHTRASDTHDKEEEEMKQHLWETL